MMLSLKFFFFNDTATTEIYTLSLHDALPISTTLGELRASAYPDRTVKQELRANLLDRLELGRELFPGILGFEDRKSTRLNSSHSQISYAVFCLKNKKKLTKHIDAHLSCSTAN